MTEQTRIPYKAFIAAAARAFAVPIDRLIGVDRHTEVVRARFAAALLIRLNRKDASLPEIGRRLGGKDHTTVLHAISRANRFLKTDEDFRNCYLAAERDALSWTPGAPRTVICVVDVAEDAPRRGRPPAVKIEAPAPRPIVSARTSRNGNDDCDRHDGQMSAQWWFANDRRFRAAMLKAHPERAPVGMREAAE